MRGLDYYTRTLFEFTSDALGAQSGVGGGGRYDRLIEQLGGPPTPAVGLGRRRRADAARGGRAADRARSSSTCSSRARTATRAGARTAFELARDARRAGLAAQLELAGRSLKGQLKHADRIGARYVAIVGDPEHASLQEHGVRASSARLEPGDVIPTILRGSRLS